MCKAIKVESRTKASTPHMLSLFLSWNFVLFIFVSFFKLNPQNQITMDEHRHKILVILVIFMAISQAEKIETPSIIHKQAHKFNEKKGK
jgi:hypothetical protein